MEIRHHIGIILSVIFSVIGTVLLAFSLTIKSHREIRIKGVAATQTSINKPLFWSGLGLIAAGSLMQLLQW